MEIDEAVKDVSTELLSQPPSIPWRQVAAMRNQLAHRYFDTSHAVVAHTVGPDLVELLAAPGHCWRHWTPQAEPIPGDRSKADPRPTRAPCPGAETARSKVSDR